ncbi:carbohydrate kinase family protein [Lysobacter gummosus]|uniref:carbohydrate kinase family protein n=1 Tax=Lysobacter gummosus TaxID=262324 RepID=UPI0036395DD3
MAAAAAVGYPRRTADLRQRHHHVGGPAAHRRRAHLLHQLRASATSDAGLRAETPAAGLARQRRFVHRPFLLPGLRERFRQLLAQASAKGYQIALDTGWPPEGWTPQVHEEVEGWLAHCDHLLVNELEAMSIAGNPDDCHDLELAVQRVAGLLKPGAHLIVKLGAAGALGHVDGRSIRYATQETLEIFDTVGAGDSFNTGYLAARLNRASLIEALAAGCRTAAAILPRFPRKSIAAGELSHCLLPQS